jgi:hypothetical protein
LTVSALGVAVAMAASSAAAGLETAVVLGDDPADGSGLEAQDLAVVRDFAGSGVPVLRADPRGGITHTSTT